VRGLHGPSLNVRTFATMAQKVDSAGEIVPVMLADPLTEFMRMRPAPPPPPPEFNPLPACPGDPLAVLPAPPAPPAAPEVSAFPPAAGVALGVASFAAAPE
jgi:hypothetical protein